MIEYLRWVLVIPASLGGYFISMFLGVSTHIAFTKLCRIQDVVSKMCAATYMEKVENISLIVFPSLAAILVVLLPSLIAPAHKLVVACIAYVLGAIVAIYLGISIGTYPILLATIISGAIMLYVVYRVVSMPNKSMQLTANTPAE
jgi:hypothetical protein